MHIKYFSFILAMTLGIIPQLSATSVIVGGKYSVTGTYVEGCDCNVPCPCEITNSETGCQSVSAMSLKNGNFMGTDLSGAEIVVVSKYPEWVRIYIDAKNDKQKNASVEFAKEIYGDRGKIEAINNAKIDLSEKDNNFIVKVDDGKVMQLTTQPILGGDKTTPITYTNTSSKLTPVFMQARVISCNFSDGERQFELKGSNSFFNTNMKSKGSFE